MEKMNPHPLVLIFEQGYYDNVIKPILTRGYIKKIWHTLNLNRFYR
jgi:hypothetical protein